MACNPGSCTFQWKLFEPHFFKERRRVDEHLMLPVLEHFAATLDNKSPMWPESAAAAVVQAPHISFKKKGDLGWM